MAGLLARARARLHAASAARALAAHWRTKYEALRAQVQEHARREREERVSLKGQSMRRARRIPSVETLQHMLRARTALAQRRAGQLQVGGADVDRANLDGSARRLTVDGLIWWVPTLPSQSAASIERMLAKQRFPYLAIAQTRDVAVGGIMLDIGANVGRMAIPRVILGDSTKAFCSEPDDLNFRCLAANVRENRLDGLVIPDRVAMSDRVGRLPLQRGKMSGGHRVVQAGVVPDDAETVPCTTLDAWVVDHAIDLADVRFVKIDTQGSEVHVLAGASLVLAQPHIAWQIEVAPSHLRLAGSDSRILHRMLAGRFTHFTDLNPEAVGPRLRPIGDLAAALEYLEDSDDAQTDIVVYRAEGEPSHVQKEI